MVVTSSISGRRLGARRCLLHDASGKTRRCLAQLLGRSGQLPRCTGQECRICRLQFASQTGVIRAYAPFLHPCVVAVREFDVVIERDGWIFARKGDGYLALYSQQPYRWHTDAASEKTHNEIIADGKHNIWICELGRRADDGDFETFMKRITGARSNSAVKCDYESPTG